MKREASSCLEALVDLCATADRLKPTEQLVRRLCWRMSLLGQIKTLQTDSLIGADAMASAWNNAKKLIFDVKTYVNHRERYRVDQLRHKRESPALRMVVSMEYQHRLVDAIGDFYRRFCECTEALDDSGARGSRALDYEDLLTCFKACAVEALEERVSQPETALVVMGRVMQGVADFAPAGLMRRLGHLEPPSPSECAAIEEMRATLFLLAEGRPPGPSPLPPVLHALPGVAAAEPSSSQPSQDARARSPADASLRTSPGGAPRAATVGMETLPPPAPIASLTAQPPMAVSVEIVPTDAVSVVAQPVVALPVGELVVETLAVDIAVAQLIEGEGQDEATLVATSTDGLELVATDSFRRWFAAAHIENEAHVREYLTLLARASIFNARLLLRHCEVAHGGQVAAALRALGIRRSTHVLSLAQLAGGEGVDAQEAALASLGVLRRPDFAGDWARLLDSLDIAHGEVLGDQLFDLASVDLQACLALLAAGEVDAWKGQRLVGGCFPEAPQLAELLCAELYREATRLAAERPVRVPPRAWTGGGAADETLVQAQARTQARTQAQAEAPEDAAAASREQWRTDLASAATGLNGTASLVAALFAESWAEFERAEGHQDKVAIASIVRQAGSFETGASTKLAQSFLLALYVWGVVPPPEPQAPEWPAAELGQFLQAMSTTLDLRADDEAKLHTLLGAFWDAVGEPARAVGMYHLAAEHGVAASQRCLGWSYNKGEGVARSTEEAAQWYWLAAEQGHARAQFLLGDCHALGVGVAQDQAEALRWYRCAATQGHAAAQFALGSALSRPGGGEPADCMEEAVQWFWLAAEQGHADAQCSLGYCHHRGLGVPVDKAEAIRLFHLAAAQGHADGQFKLGLCYSSGDGVPVDATEAVRWWRLAADRSHAGAQFSLASCLQRGVGVPVDMTEAVLWNRRAAALGDASAQFALGNAYVQGEGVATDMRQAARWYTLAANQGHAGAQYHLGLCLLHGKGVPHSSSTAARWLAKAAEQGNQSAREALRRLA